MWPLLIWAYRRQMVHYEWGGDDGPSGYRGSWSMMGLGAGSERGTINGAGTTAHADAHEVHGFVCMLTPQDRHLIVSTAERGRAPNWNPHVEPHRFVPVRKGGNGAPRMLYRNGRPVACMIEPVGVPDDEVRAIRREARQTYLHWWKLLRKLRLSLQIAGQSLTRWKVVETGAPRAPWAAPADRVAGVVALQGA
jgi:hypothetical protein